MDTATIPETRITRGIALYRERGGEIERTTANTYRVPSCTGSARYLVMLDISYCSCPDHRRAKELGESCKHRVAATIARAKRRSGATAA